MLGCGFSEYCLQPRNITSSANAADTRITQAWELIMCYVMLMLQPGGRAVAQHMVMLTSCVSLLTVGLWFHSENVSVACGHVWSGVVTTPPLKKVQEPKKVS